jgi:hypothetical protein
MKMSANDWLVNFLNKHINDSKPDGRPLYAYKCTDVAYNRLKEIVGEMFSSARSGYPSLYFARMFCLFAAETWRRNSNSR